MHTKLHFTSKEIKAIWRFCTVENFCGEVKTKRLLSYDVFRKIFIDDEFFTKL